MVCGTILGNESSRIEPRGFNSFSQLGYRVCKRSFEEISSRAVESSSMQGPPILWISRHSKT